MITGKFLAKKILVLKYFFGNHYFSPLNTLMRKGKDPVLVTNGSGLRIREAQNHTGLDLDVHLDPEHCRKVWLNCLCQFHIQPASPVSRSHFFGLPLASITANLLAGGNATHKNWHKIFAWICWENLLAIIFFFKRKFWTIKNYGTGTLNCMIQIRHIPKLDLDDMVSGPIVQICLSLYLFLRFTIIFFLSLLVSFSFL